MKRLAEALLFLTLAGGLHLAAFATPVFTRAPQGMAQVGGAEGQQAVAMQAAPQQIAALLEQWEQVPEVADTPAQPSPVAPEDQGVPGVKFAPTAPRSARRVPPGMMPSAPPVVDDLPATFPADLTLPDVPVPDAPTALALPDVPAAVNAPAASTGAGRPARLLPTPLAPGVVQDAAMQLPDALPPPPMTRTELAPENSLRPIVRPDVRPVQKVAKISKPKATSAAKQKAKPKNKPKAKAASKPRPQAKAKGQGGGTTAGRKTNGSGQKKSKAKTAPKVSAAARAKWEAQIVHRTRAQQRYPRGTKASGRVLIGMRIAPSGKLLSVQIKRSSGHAALDKAALQAAKRARFPKAPKGMRKSSYSYSISLAFKR